MRNFLTILLLISTCLILVACERFPDDMTAKRINSLLASDSEANNLESDEANGLDKRHERYGFGLGRRSYVLTTNSQGKRLPSYDFGLGKRSRPYSFGLGKRNFDDDYPESEYGSNFLTSNVDDPNNTDLEFLRKSNNKRGRPYSFGLGKRAALRGNDQRYNFGLGKR